MYSGGDMLEKSRVKMLVIFVASQRLNHPLPAAMNVYTQQNTREGPHRVVINTYARLELKHSATN